MPISLCRALALHDLTKESGVFMKFLPLNLLIWGAFLINLSSVQAKTHSLSEGFEITLVPSKSLKTANRYFVFQSGKKIETASPHKITEAKGPLCLVGETKELHSLYSAVHSQSLNPKSPLNVTVVPVNGAGKVKLMSGNGTLVKCYRATRDDAPYTLEELQKAFGEHLQVRRSTSKTRAPASHAIPDHTLF